MTEEQSFKKKVISGFIWIGTGSALGQLLTWISTLIIIRLLNPSDYGLMAMASTFISILTTVGELGIGASIIQAENITGREVRIISGVVLLTSIFGMSVCYLSTPWIAAFYSEPRLVPILRVMTVVFIFLALYAIPQSLLTREMNFAVKTKVDLFAKVGGSVITLVCALKGLGVWALVFGFISIHTIKLIGFNLVKPVILKPLFCYGEAKKFLKYGVMVTSGRMLYTLYTEADKIIVGRVLGNNLLGIYSVATNLASIPADKVLPIISEVMFTSYSRIQNEKERIRKNLIRTTRAIAYSGFPLFFGMAAVAPEGVPLLLGPRWVDLVVPFQLFCLVMPLRALSPVLSPAIFAVGKPEVNFWSVLINLFVMVMAFLVGVKFGMRGVCLAWVIAFPFVFIINSIRCLKELGIPLSEFFSEMKFPLIASLLMGALISTIRVLVHFSPTVYSLLIMVILGTMFYVLSAYLFNKKEILEIKELLKK